MSGGVEDVRTWNLSFTNVSFPFRIKTGVGRGGFVRRLDFGSASIAQVPPGGKAFEFSEFYGGHPKHGYNKSAIPEVGAVHVHDVTGEAEVAAELLGILEDPAGATAPGRYAMQGVTFDSVNVSGSWRCSNVWGAATATAGACPCLASGCHNTTPAHTHQLPDD